MAIGIGAAILGGAAIGGLSSILGGQAAGSGARASARAQQQMFEQMRTDLSGYREAGLSGLEGIQSLLRDPSSALDNPAYNFALGEGQRAITGKAAAGGTLQSGSTLKDLTRFGQGLATSTYQQAIQNQMGLANIGMQAASQGAASGAAMAPGIGGSLQQAGAYQGAGIAGVGQAAVGGMQDYAMMQYMNQGNYQPRLDTGAGTHY